MRMRTVNIGRTACSLAEDNRTAEIFSVKQYQQLKSGILRVWTNTFDYACQNGNTSLEFPYLLIKKQSDELSEVYQRTYWDCPLAYDQVRRLRNIEVEFHQLEAAFKWLPHARSDDNSRDINSIFIAARIMFAEFKEDRCQDCEERLALFASHIEKLIKELSLALTKALRKQH